MSATLENVPLKKSKNQSQDNPTTSSHPLQHDPIIPTMPPVIRLLTNFSTILFPRDVF